jgi:hypothetical protein
MPALRNIQNLSQREPQRPAKRLQRTADFATARPAGAANLKRFSNKAMGVAPNLFTTFGVWPGLWTGDMVNMQMRFTHRFARMWSTINQLPAAGWTGHSGTTFSLPGIWFQDPENPSGPSPASGQGGKS